MEFPYTNISTFSSLELLIRMRLDRSQENHSKLFCWSHLYVFMLFFTVVFILSWQQLTYQRSVQGLVKHLRIFPTGIYMFKVNNRNTRTRCEICLKLTKKIPEQRQWRRSGVFIVNFKHTSHLVLLFLLLTLGR